jgi:hypothetical protein
MGDSSISVGTAVIQPGLTCVPGEHQRQKQGLPVIAAIAKKKPLGANPAPRGFQNLFEHYPITSNVAGPILTHEYYPSTKIAVGRKRRIL